MADTSAEERRTSKPVQRSLRGNYSTVGEGIIKGIESYLNGAQFPAGKEEVIRWAKISHAPEDVLEILNKLEDRNYQTVAEVEKKIAQLK